MDTDKDDIIEIEDALRQLGVRADYKNRDKDNAIRWLAELLEIKKARVKNDNTTI
jgi:uncharacterized protein Smg (DUF494 family)